MNNQNIERNNDFTNQSKEMVTGIVFSPFQGRLIPLSETNDEVFRNGYLGQGVAVQPEIGEVLSPVNGMVMSLISSKHAIGILSDEGLEVLIHIGIDTVELQGKHFETFIKQDERVKIGQKLIAFDIPAIIDAGYDLTSPVVVTNSADFLDVLPCARKRVFPLEPLIEVYR